VVAPFLLVYRAETGTGWREFFFSLLFLLAHGFVWAVGGYHLPAVIRSEGLRFLAKYGGVVLVTVVLAFFVPWVSGVFVLPTLWEGRAEGWPGLALYLGLGGMSALWSWRKPKRS
jgi:hypothetical protein